MGLDVIANAIINAVILHALALAGFSLEGVNPGRLAYVISLTR